MDKERLARTGKWVDGINDGIVPSEPGAFLVRCVCNAMTEAITAILADEPDAEEYRGPFKTVVGMVAECLPDDPQFVADLAQKIADANDYYDDGTPGEYGGDPDDDPVSAKTTCPYCGVTWTTYTADHTRTTNPDGTRTPCDEPGVFAGPLTGDEYKVSPPLDDSLMSHRSDTPAEVVEALRLIDLIVKNGPPAELCTQATIDSLAHAAAAVRSLSREVLEENGDAAYAIAKAVMESMQEDGDG